MNSEYLKIPLPDWSTGESPFLPKNLAKLYTRPDQFFSSNLALINPLNYLLAVWILGLGFLFLVPLWMAGLLHGTLIDLYLPILIFGVIFGGILFFLGGLGYLIRLNLAIGNRPGGSDIWVLFLYLSLIWALPALLMGPVEILSIAYLSEPVSLSLVFFLVEFMLIALYSRSIIISHRTVIAIFKVKEKQARFLFLILPHAIPLTLLGFLCYVTFQSLQR